MRKAVAIQKRLRSGGKLAGAAPGFAYDLLATNLSELNAAIATAAATPTVDTVIALSSAVDLGALTISGRVMSGTLAGVPVQHFLRSERNQVWDPHFTGGSITIRGLGPKPKFSAGVTVTGSTGIVFRDVIMGFLQPVAMYSYEPETGEQVTITAATQANPCVLTVTGGVPSKVRVGAKVRIAGATGMTGLGSAHHTVLANTGSTITIAYDASAQPAYTGSGLIYGADNRTTTGINPAGVMKTAFIAQSGSDVVCRDMEFSNRALTADAAYWADLVGQGDYKRLVLCDVLFDGFQNALKCGEGADILTRNLVFRNGIADNIANRSRYVVGIKGHRPSVSIAGITTGAVPVVTTTAAHGLKRGDMLCIEGVTGTTEALTAQTAESAISGITLGATTVISVAQTSSFTPGTTVRVTGINTGPTGIMDLPLRVTARSVVSGAGTITLAVDSSAMAAWVNGGVVRRIPAWMVDTVPSPTTLTLRMIKAEVGGTVAVDGTGWTAYVSGGTLIGPVENRFWLENAYMAEQAADARFTAPHSDGAQFGASTNECNCRLMAYDWVISPTVPPDMFNATQALFMTSGAVDSTKVVGEGRNILMNSSAPNQYIAPTTEDWRWELAFATADRQPNAYFPSSDGIWSNPYRMSHTLSCIGPPRGGGSSAVAITSDSDFTLSPNDDRSAIFAGPFVADINGNRIPDPAGPLTPTLRTTAALAVVMAAYAQQWKGIGANAGRGFGGDPDAIWFTGIADTAAPVISSVVITPTSNTASVARSIDKGHGFEFWLVSLTAGITDKDAIIALAKAGGAKAGIIGLNAAGAQAPINVGGLPDATLHSFYSLVRDRQGNETLSETPFTTAALTKPVIQQIVDTPSTATSATFESAAITPGSLANRGLVVVLEPDATATTTDLSGVVLTYGTPGRGAGLGTPLAIITSRNLNGSGARRPRGIVAFLPAPAAGVAGTVKAEYKDAALAGQNCISHSMQIIELSNVDQNPANAITGTNDSKTAGTSLAGTITTPVANCLIIGAACLFGGTGTTTGHTVTGSATMPCSGFTGPAGSNDHWYALFHEDVAAAGTDGFGLTWTTAADAALVIAGFRPA